MNEKIRLDRFLVEIPAEDQFWVWFSSEHMNTLTASLRRQYAEHFSEIEMCPNEVLRVRAGLISSVTQLQNLPKTHKEYSEALQSQEVYPDDPSIIE